MLRIARLLLAALLPVLLTGCIVAPHHRHPEKVVVYQPGPPPHAPAHGHRHKHHRHEPELVFDSHVGVYVVVGWEHTFFLDDHYYRFADGRWQTSIRLREGWVALPERRVPKNLRVRYAKKKHDKHHDHERTLPARHAD